jgi:hypothetical protein
MQKVYLVERGIHDVGILGVRSPLSAGQILVVGRAEERSAPFCEFHSNLNIFDLILTQSFLYIAYRFVTSQ